MSQKEVTRFLCGPENQGTHGSMGNKATLLGTSVPTRPWVFLTHRVALSRCTCLASLGLSFPICKVEAATASNTVG